MIIIIILFHLDWKYLLEASEVNTNGSWILIMNYVGYKEVNNETYL